MQTRTMQKFISVWLACICAGNATAFWLPCNGKMTAFSWGKQVFATASNQSIEVFNTKTAMQIASIPITFGKVNTCVATDNSVAWIATDSNGQSKVVFVNDLQKREPQELALNLSDASSSPLIIGDKIYLVGSNWRQYSSVSQTFEMVEPVDERGVVIKGQPILLANDLISTISPYKLETENGKKRILSRITTYNITYNQLKFLASYISDGPTYQSCSVKKQNRNSVITEAEFLLKQSNLTVQSDGVTVWETKDRVELPFRETKWVPNRIARTSSTDSAPFWQITNGLITLKNESQTHTFLPWNGASEKVLGVVPQSGSLWVFSNNGVSLIQPTISSTDFGFSGFISQIEGDDDQEKWSDKQKQLVIEMKTWFGTKYVYGGNDRNGIDCSGLVQQAFKTIGINLPRTSATMRIDKKGILVKDILRAGDVLTYPGHVAVYIGGGKTIETVKGGVSYGSIWSRRDVVVRRYLGP